jgi:hypothetical protein
MAFELFFGAMSLCRFREADCSVLRHDHRCGCWKMRTFLKPLRLLASIVNDLVLNGRARVKMKRNLRKFGSVCRAERKLRNSSVTVGNADLVAHKGVLRLVG